MTLSELSSLRELDAPLHILYVEDNPDDILFMEISLKKIFGDQFNLVALHSVEDAKRVLYQSQFDILLLDMYLPDAQGLHGLETLLTSFPYQAVVVITGTDDTRLGLKAIKAGAQDYLTKGDYTGETVLRVIRYAVERNRITSDLMRMAEYDTLTGLANRAGFHNYLNNALAQAARKNTNVALLFIDLDNFKIINDTLGHDVGDQYLKGIANIFKNTLRNTDFLARLGGDEFTAVIQCDQVGINEPLAVAQKMLDALMFPIKIPEGQAINGGCSIGIALWKPDHSIACDNTLKSSAKKLINQADTAMYQAKQNQGSCYQFYDDELKYQAEEKVEHAQELREAWEDKQLILYYQPIHCTHNQKLASAEVIVRWQSPKRGLIDPSTFFRHIEETQLISDIGFWIINQSCIQFKQWIESGLLNEKSWISIDISPTHFLNPNLTDEIHKILTANNMAAKHLRLELTESMLMRDAAIEQLKKLKVLGVSIAIDHFGTGYSSMRYLKTDAIDSLIIDKSYVKNFLTNRESQSSTRAMIRLGHTLGKSIVAEGVESEALFRVMQELKCDYTLGGFLGQPMLPDELVKANQYNIIGHKSC